MKGSTASAHGYLSRYSQHLNVGPRRCRSVRRLRRRRVSLRNNVSSAWFFLLVVFAVIANLGRSTKHQVQSTKLPRSKYKALNLRGFVVDLVRDGSQNQRYFRITDLRRLKTNLDIKIPFGRSIFERVRLDRKSTRLNSSHSQISYAVFCLKKKYYSI